jgi:hypothetical protein
MTTMSDNVKDSNKKQKCNTKNVINLPNASTNLSISQDTSPLFQIPEEILRVIVEYCIGNLDYAGIYSGFGVRKVNGKWRQTHNDSTSHMLLAGIWWANDPLGFPMFHLYKPINALAIHWMKSCVPLMLSCKEIMAIVKTMPQFDEMKHFAGRAVALYHDKERQANFRKWFQEKRDAIEALGHEVALTVQTGSNGVVENPHRNMRKFPHIDMDDRKFYCVVDHPVHSINYDNYLKAIKLVEQMNVECQPFLEENYKCSHCK